MQSSPSANMTNILIYVVLIGLFVFRMSRPQRFTRTRLFVMPGILLLATAFSIWGNAMAAAALGAAAAPPVQVALALIAGAAIGIPLGVVRGRHSEVKPTDRPGVMYVHSSPLIVIVWLAAFMLRAVIRYFMPHASELTAVISDGLLAFAVGALITSYVIIYQRYKAMTAAMPAAAAAQ